MTNNTTIPTSELGMESGDVIYIEKVDSYYASPTEILNITKSSIEFYAPTYQTGGSISFKPGESVKVYYWTKSGQKYSFTAMIQAAKSLTNTYAVGIPMQAQLDGGRRWTRYKPVNMITSFMHKNNTNKLNDTVYIARVANISAGGMLISTAKRFNIEDTLGVGFYAGNSFFTAVCVVKSSNVSKSNPGENEVALQFTNYTDQDKDFLENKLHNMHR